MHALGVRAPRGKDGPPDMLGSVTAACALHPAARLESGRKARGRANSALRTGHARLTATRAMRSMQHSAAGTRVAAISSHLAWHGRRRRIISSLR